MDVPSLLGKELRWGRHKLLALAAVFVVLPAVFAYVTGGFQHVLPTDAPIAVAPRTAAVTGDDLRVARAAVTVFSDPVIYQSRADALTALGREQVYAVVSVPPALADSARGAAAFTVYIDGSVVPYHEPSRAIVRLLQSGLGTAIPRDVTVSRKFVGTQYSLSTYLVPSFVVSLTAIVALGYLPQTFEAEAAVLDRLRVETSLYAVVASKLLFFAALLVVPLVVFDAVTAVTGGSVSVLGVATLAVVVVTFLLLGLVAVAIQLLAGFGVWGRILNLLVLLFVLGFSGVVYPVGFFSPARRWVVRQVPTHYAVVTIRGLVLRGQPISAYADWLGGLVAAVGVAALVAGGTIELYERRA